jgi:hypothetical protein
MQVGSGAFTYEWIEPWARIPDTASGKENGRTHGVAVSKTGKVIVFNQANPGVLIYSAEGQLLDSWGDRFGGAHGLRLVEENGVEYLWLVDQNNGEVCKCTLAGETVLSLEMPSVEARRKDKWVPTWASEYEKRHGGDGSVWVADGYGSGTVTRYLADGTWVKTLTGEEGAGKFNCPHAVFVDVRRPGEPELLVADRGNRRIQVYDLEGAFKRACAWSFLTSPCDFAIHGETLVVPELFGRISLLDLNNRLICYLGENYAAVEEKGWPNHPAAKILQGKFNSPHGCAVDAHGSIFIVEWIIGGRIIKLEKR